MTNGKLQQAINFAMAHETGWARSPDQSPWGVHQTDPAPWNRLFGPVHERGGVCGVIMQDGNVLAGFGDTGRADLTFSVAKTYLALLAGVAHEQGLLPDVHEAVGARLSGIGFDDDHNSAVTWHHLLQQTSEWTGECFGIPDQVDHYRQLEFAPPTGGTKGDRRPLHQPGSYWEYNDVRINQLSLALLHLFRRPLPDVFAEFIAGPAGASTDWAWRGYDNAWVNIDGKRMQSVPGGTHWGGGVSISASDQARIGQILLGRGYANGRQILAAGVDRRDERTLPDCTFLWLSGLAQPGAADLSLGTGYQLLRAGCRRQLHVHSTRRQSLLWWCAGWTMHTPTSSLLRCSTRLPDGGISRKWRGGHRDPLSPCRCPPAASPAKGKTA
jgi:CubicO group peptidase (beta-lactamase class C family)